MPYTISGLDPARFEALFSLPDHELAARSMRWVTATAPHGFPCRIGLDDATPGERLLLLPFAHQDGQSPYRASGPIFVRPGFSETRRLAGELPPYLTSRILSVRAYDRADDMVDAEVADGAGAEPLILDYLARDDVAYLQLHFARRGCYACRVDRCPAPS